MTDISISNQLLTYFRRAKSELTVTTYVGLSGPHFTLDNLHSYDGVPVVRLHSECILGDQFGINLCDCGDQLTDFFGVMRDRPAILVYLMQEGRALGLDERVREWSQAGDVSFDQDGILSDQRQTATDQRSFREAAAILQALNIDQIELTTRNQKKIKDLQECGIRVERAHSSN